MGRSDLAYDLASQTTYPSWGYMISHGATTLWELWQERTGPSMNSHNHPMFGSVAGWMYQALAGINYDSARPGFERIIVQPRMVEDLKWVSGSIQTERGLVAVSWNRTPDRVAMEVTIPVGSESEIHVPRPRQPGGKLTEGGQPVTPGNGIVSLKEGPDEFVVVAGSGLYRFRVE
jgi:alpha-L-rhamnosidase